MAGDRFIKIMQNAAKQPASESTDLIFGVVTSIAPLKVKVDNRFEVGAEFLILSALVKETIIKIPKRDVNTHTHTIPASNTGQAGEGPHSHSIPAHITNAAMPDILLWRGLIVGDNVRMLRVNSGQMFYILEREEGIL